MSQFVQVITAVGDREEAERISERLVSSKFIAGPEKTSRSREFWKYHGLKGGEKRGVLRRTI